MTGNMSDLHDRLARLRQAGRLTRRPPASAPLASSDEEEAPPPALSGRTDLPWLDAEDGTMVADLADLPGMEVIEDRRGSFLRRTLSFDLTHNQGSVAVGALLDLPAAASALAGNDPALAEIDFRRALFLDTETSGLAGGTGTIAFLTGIGRFEEDRYVVRQYFARTPAEEPAYLSHVATLWEDASGLVTFNGKSFDLPLLRTRFMMAGLRPPNLQLPHLDLLPPARRLWRERLGACNFGNLEAEVLGHQRGGQDVPSWLIPSLWFRYASGANNVHDMAHVLYHNLHDIISMAPLAHIICGVFGGMVEPHPHDLLALAHSHARQGRVVEAEAVFRRALDKPLGSTQEAEAVAGLAEALKHQNRSAEAATWWEARAAMPLGASTDIVAPIELAKYHEWETKELETALRWTEKARALVLRWRPGYQRAQALAEIEHRRERLLRKLES